LSVPSGTTSRAGLLAIGAISAHLYNETINSAAKIVEQDGVALVSNRLPTAAVDGAWARAS
jgi:hypothetical protein